jgi:hypothetical protein
MRSRSGTNEAAQTVTKDRWSRGEPVAAVQLVVPERLCQDRVQCLEVWQLRVQKEEECLEPIVYGMRSRCIAFRHRTA